MPVDPRGRCRGGDARRPIERDPWRSRHDGAGTARVLPGCRGPRLPPRTPRTVKSTSESKVPTGESVGPQAASPFADGQEAAASRRSPMRQYLFAFEEPRPPRRAAIRPLSRERAGRMRALRRGCHVKVSTSGLRRQDRHERVMSLSRELLPRAGCSSRGRGRTERSRCGHHELKVFPERLRIIGLLMRPRARARRVVSRHDESAGPGRASSRRGACRRRRLFFQESRRSAHVTERQAIAAGRRAPICSCRRAGSRWILRRLRTAISRRTALDDVGDLRLTVRSSVAAIILSSSCPARPYGMACPARRPPARAPGQRRSTFAPTMPRAGRTARFLLRA